MTVLATIAPGGNMREWVDRWLARYLKRRGWVVFWLDEDARHCIAPGHCWLALYESERKAGR